MDIDRLCDRYRLDAQGIIGSRPIPWPVSRQMQLVGERRDHRAWVFRDRRAGWHCVFASFVSPPVDVVLLVTSAPPPRRRPQRQIQDRKTAHIGQLITTTVLILLGPFSMSGHQLLLRPRIGHVGYRIRTDPTSSRLVGEVPSKALNPIEANFMVAQSRLAPEMKWEVALSFFWLLVCTVRLT